MEQDKVKDSVRRTYAEIARSQVQSCCPSSCCGNTAESEALRMGYQSDDLKNIPEEAVLGLGCGNPTAIADLEEGQVVVDLGSGAGIDAFLAANKVGPKGRVIGVDMTKEMVDRARELARTNGYENVEFRLGEIENLPVENDSVDVIISNCVVNLSPDKDRVFREACRVLKPKGKLVVSDIVSEAPLPESLRQDMDAWAECIGGALERGDYLARIERAGFGEVNVTSEREFYVEAGCSGETCKIMSVTVEAHKPG
jgi:arsenite methyltransferase